MILKLHTHTHTNTNKQWPLFSSSLARLGWIAPDNEIKLSVLGTIVWSIAVPVSNYIHFPIQLLVLFLVFSITGCEILVFRKQKDRAMMAPSRAEFHKAIICLLIAAFFSFLDVSRTWCDPTRHIVQGHAIWHCFSSLGLFFAGKYCSQQYAYTEA